MARGVAITLVAILHVYNGLSEVVPRHWVQRALNELFFYHRMPVFFFVAGLLATRALRRPLGEVFLRRVLPFLYLYVLWGVLRSLWLDAIPIHLAPPQPSAFPTLLWWPESTLWFLYALALYTAAAALLRGLPRGLHVALALLPSSIGFAFPEIFPVYTFRYAAWFYAAFVIGASYGEAIADFLLRRNPWVVVGIAGAVQIVLFPAILWLDADRVPPVPFAMLAASLAGDVVLARLVAPLLVGRLLAFLGQRTLPIYVLHAPALLLIGDALAEFGVILPWPAQFPIAALSIGMALCAGWATRRVPGLYEAPWLRWVGALVEPRPGTTPMRDGRAQDQAAA